MKIQLSFIFLLFSIVATAQEPVFFNSWQYLDEEGYYCEVTITKKHTYMYVDSGGVDRYRSKVKNKTLAFNNEHWVIQQSDSVSISIITDNKDTLKLYMLPSLGNELISFYDWANKHRNGNGYIMLWRDAGERKTSFLNSIE